MTDETAGPDAQVERQVAAIGFQMLGMNCLDVRPLLDANAESSQRCEQMRPCCRGPALRKPCLAHERDLQTREGFGNLGRELDPGQAAADDRDASLLLH